MSRCLIYGANGYTGELIAREALRRGLRPMLAGRDAAAIAALASELGLPGRTLGLDDPAALADALAGCRAVLHCAGPFSATAAPMISACLAAGVHYLDITGEIDVFEAMVQPGYSGFTTSFQVGPRRMIPVSLRSESVPTHALRHPEWRIRARLWRVHTWHKHMHMYVCVCASICAY